MSHNLIFFVKCFQITYPYSEVICYTLTDWILLFANSSISVFQPFCSQEVQSTQAIYDAVDKLNTLTNRKTKRGEYGLYNAEQRAKMC